MKSFFVTGTDTDAGKTYVSCQLLKALHHAGHSVIGLKPISAGADADGLNADAKALQQCSSCAIDYQQVNPILLQQPAAPHLAAKAEGMVLTQNALDQALALTAEMAVEYRLIEGAGGWLLPLDATYYYSDWVLAQQLPVILVVGVKLGCLNHAMLTARELQRSGATVLGWVANCVSPEMLFLKENIADLTARLPWPLLGTFDYASPDNVAAQQHNAAVAKLSAAQLVDRLQVIETL